MLFKDIEAAVERGAQGRIITSTYQNFTDIESIKSFFALQCKHSNVECHAYLYIRKVSDENGIVLPFIYAGKEKMTNPRRQVKYDKAKGKDVVTYLYDIVMENELPDYLQYDFGLTK